jgi:carboxymethylenebutenolidase
MHRLPQEMAGPLQASSATRTRTGRPIVLKGYLMTAGMFDKLKLAFVASVMWALFTASALADSTTVQVGVNKTMAAQLMVPDGPGPFPAILLLHTSGGLQTADLDYARRLVAEGYVVLVPAFLEAYGIQAKTRQLTFTSYAQPIYADFVAILEWLRSNHKVKGTQLGAIGFSNGGYFALWLAASGQVQAGVSYYGALSGAGTDKSLSRFQQVFSAKSAPVLILHGTSDGTVPFSNATELDKLLTDKQAPHEFFQYAGAEHRFERDRSASNDAAAEDAWQRSLVFLNRLLKD